MNPDGWLHLEEAVHLLRHAGVSAHGRALVLAKAANTGAVWWLRSRGEFCVFGTIPHADDSLLEALRRHVGKLVLRLDCTGGSGDTAGRIGAWLEGRSHTLAVVDGTCQSAAIHLLLGCERREARPEASFMVHASRAAVFGTVAELRAAADALEAQGGPQAGFLARRTGQPASVVESWLAGPDDKRFTAAEAVAAGFVHEIVAQPAPVISVEDLPVPSGAIDAGDELALELARALRQLHVHDREQLRNLLAPLL